MHAVLDRVRAAGKACVVHTLPAGRSNGLTGWGDLRAPLEAGNGQRRAVVAWRRGHGRHCCLAASVIMRLRPLRADSHHHRGAGDSSVGGKTGVNTLWSRTPSARSTTGRRVSLTWPCCPLPAGPRTAAGMRRSSAIGDIADADLFAYLEENAVADPREGPLTPSLALGSVVRYQGRRGRRGRAEQVLRANQN